MSSLLSTLISSGLVCKQEKERSNMDLNTVPNILYDMTVMLTTVHSNKIDWRHFMFIV